MRFSSFLVSIALLLSISSVAAQTLMSGYWSNPSITKSSSSFCCIPTSIDISCSGTGCTANYKYPNEFGSKCWSLFLSSTSGKVNLYKSGSTYYTDTYYSETTFFGSMKFNFVASNSTGTPNLNIYTSSSSYYDGCDFTMQSRVGPSGNIGGLIIFIIIFFIIVASAGAKQYQKKQANIIIAQNLAQQPVTTVPGFNFNTAPTVVQVHQPQPQPIYTAPNQFPNTQVNMNYGAQQFPNTQVNMNFGGKNAGFQAQARF